VPPERLQEIFDSVYSSPPELIAEWLRLTQPNAPEDKARAETVKATLTSASGSRISFEVANTKREARLDRQLTSITIGGSKAEPDALKAGLVCSITYFGDKGTATAIACN
jgi:hypothetical protein